MAGEFRAVTGYTNKAIDLVRDLGDLSRDMSVTEQVRLEARDALHAIRQVAYAELNIGG